MKMSPDTLEVVGVNDLFVAVTVDASFTTEQVVVGHMDERHILTVVRTTPIVGCLSPSQICDSCSLLRTRKMDMEMSPDTLEDFLFFLEFFFKNSRPMPVNRRCLMHPHFRAHV